MLPKPSSNTDPIGDGMMVGLKDIAKATGAVIRFAMLELKPVD